MVLAKLLHMQQCHHQNLELAFILLHPLQHPMPESSSVNEDDVIANQIALQYAGLTSSLPSILSTFLGGSAEGKPEENQKDDIEPQETTELSVVTIEAILISELT
jgi:hypothetical protein